MTAILDTIRLMSFVFVPVFAAAFVMHLFSSFVGRRAQKSVGFKVYAWLTSPGTIVHELGHAFFCLLFGHRIDKISLFNPQPDGTLGFVDHSWDAGSLYQRIGNFFIGTGPIWFGCAAVYLLSLVLVGDTLFAPLTAFRATPLDILDYESVVNLAGRYAGTLHSVGAAVPGIVDGGWKFWLFAYLTMCIGLSMSLSISDLKGAAAGFVMLVLVSFVANLGGAVLVTFIVKSSTAVFISTMTARMVSFSLVVTGILAFTVFPALLVSMLMAMVSAGFRSKSRG